MRADDGAVTGRARRTDALVSVAVGLGTFLLYWRTLLPHLGGTEDTPKFQYLGAVLGTARRAGDQEEAERGRGEGDGVRREHRMGDDTDSRRRARRAVARAHIDVVSLREQREPLDRRYVERGRIPGLARRERELDKSPRRSGRNGAAT